jgi:hypothetical protein
MQKDHHRFAAVFNNPHSNRLKPPPTDPNRLLKGRPHHLCLGHRERGPLRGRRHLPDPHPLAGPDGRLRQVDRPRPPGLRRPGGLLRPLDARPGREVQPLQPDARRGLGRQQRLAAPRLRVHPPVRGPGGASRGGGWGRLGAVGELWLGAPVCAWEQASSNSNPHTKPAHPRSQPNRTDPQWCPTDSSDKQRCQWAVDWVTSHIEGAKMLGKPLCLQEFGKKPAGPERANLFRKVWGGGAAAVTGALCNCCCSSCTGSCAQSSCRRLLRR